MNSKLNLVFLFLFFIFCSVQGQEKTAIINDSLSFNKTLHSFARCNNMHRYRFIKKFAKQTSLQNLTIKTQAIDWLGFYRNVIVEKKGETDSVVYIVCHYDKIDGNIIALLGLLVNGSLDIVLSNLELSKGAYDNGTGVLISLSLLSWMNSHDMHYTYRFLFAGMEEYGLRGSRRYISGVKQELWNKSFYAINIDMVGKVGTKGITVTHNVSDGNLLHITEKICTENNLPLTKAILPPGALSDFYTFQGQNFGKDFSLSLMANLTGGLIPQRSYFTKYKKAIPVISFTDDAKIAISELLSTFSPVSFGEIHSFRDRHKVVDTNNLVGYQNFMKEFLKYIDARRSLQ